MVQPNGSAIGNPAFVPTDEQRAEVRDLAAKYPPQAQGYIARIMGISKTTLVKYFADDLEAGREEMLAEIGGQMIYAAKHGRKPDFTNGDFDAQRFVLARLGGWSQKTEISGPGGGPIEHVDLSRLTADQLEQYGRLAAIAAGLDPDGIIAVPR